VKNFKGLLIDNRGFVGKKWVNELAKQNLLTLISPRRNMKKIATNEQLKSLRIRQKIEAVLSVIKRFYSYVYLVDIKLLCFNIKSGKQNCPIECS